MVVRKQLLKFINIERYVLTCLIFISNKNCYLIYKETESHIDNYLNDKFNLSV